MTEQTAEATEAVVPGLGSSGECSGAGPITTQISVTPQVVAVEMTPHEQTEQDDVSVVSISAVNCSLDPTKYYTDTREIEDLMDSSGVGGPVTPKVKVTSTFVKVPALGTESTSEDESSHDQAGTSSAQHVTPGQFSASGRTLLRKYFVEKDPIALPRNQSVIALTEEQIHTVMKTISNETILSSFHLMKFLLLQVTSGKILSKENCRHVGASTPVGRRCPSSSGDETTDLDSPNEGYTSGTFNTDDEPGSLSFCLERDESQGTPTSPTTGQPSTAEHLSAGRNTPMSPGSGYSLGDYALLSSFLPKSAKSKQLQSPPRKRRKYLGKPGKTMKEVYFKGISWTKTFVTAPPRPRTQPV